MSTWIFKEDSNPYWVAIQVRNHRLPIKKLEWKRGGDWKSLRRESYNYFVEAAGMGTGPYTFRITDVYGHTVTDSGIAFAEAQVVRGKAQLPACAQ